MHVKVEIFSTEIFSAKYCTVPGPVYNVNFNFFYFAWDYEKINYKPGVWLLTNDITTRVEWVPRRI